MHVSIVYPCIKHKFNKEAIDDISYGVKIVCNPKNVIYFNRISCPHL